MTDKADKITRLSDIKIGQCFQHDINGPVYIKCRGGYRLARGGPLHSCASHVVIIPFNLTS